MVERNMASSSESSSMRCYWRQIWRCKVQPKVKHFLWRIGHNSLACNANLSKRLPMMSNLCPRCGLQDESDIHALKNCEEVRGLWLMSPLSLRVDRFQSTSLVDWVNSMLITLKADELQLFVLSLWSIWNDRNNIVFGNRRLPPDMLFSNIQSMHSGGSSGQQEVNSEVRSQNQTWNPPPPHAVKLNTDASVSIDKKMSVAGAVCRNSEGVVLKSGVCVMQGIYDVELAEAMAVEFGVKMAADILCEELIVESDSLNVIQRFHKHDGAIDHIQLIIEDCIAIPLSCSVRFQHARRSCNIVAHAMAKWGMFIGRNRLFDGEVPFPVNELIVIPS